MNTTNVVNIATVPHRSPFRYPGGKTWLVPYIRLWLDSMSNYPNQFCETFAGGAIVGLSALFDGRCQRLTLVELDEDVAAVWHTILNGNATRLADKISSFELTKENVQEELNKKPKSVLQRAFVTIVKNRVQRGGILAPGASLMKKGENGRGLLSRWYPETLKNRILSISTMKDSIQFIEGDGIEYMRQNSQNSNMVYFIDPPYTIAGRRLYTHSTINHEELFRVVSQLNGDFLMSYDNAEPVRTLAKQFGFDSQPVSMKNTHHSIMTELLIGKDLNWLRRRDTKPVQDSLFECI